MARGNAIIVNADPKGFVEEGYVTDQSLPGTHMEIVPATNPIGGRFSFRARSSANGAPGGTILLINDWEQGQIAAPATTPTANTGGHKLYYVLPGDDVNALVAESAGTGTSGENLIGDSLSLNDSGFLMAGTGTVKPYRLLDRSVLNTKATRLLWVKFLGSYA